MFLKSLLARFKQGYRTGTFPTKTGPKLPPGFRGRPVIDASITREEFEKAAAVCPCEGCLKFVNGENRLSQGDAVHGEKGFTKGAEVAALDMGKCIFCGKCAEVCGKIRFTDEYRLAVFRREDLIVKAGEGKYEPPRNPKADRVKFLKKSFQLREVSAGGCAACELDFNVLGTLAWDLGRFGMKVVASPRHADAVYVTGPVSQNMSLALRKTYEAMAEPRFVIAAGACAISGGLYCGSPEVENGTAGVIPEPDMFIPGCPPHPSTALEALLRFIGRIG